MITKEQLQELGFLAKNKNLFKLKNDIGFMFFSLKNQILVMGNSQDEIKDFKRLKEIVKLFNKLFYKINISPELEERMEERENILLDK